MARPARFFLPLLMLIASAAGAQADPAGQCPPLEAPPVVSLDEAGVERARDGWWSDHRWRYPDDSAARVAFRGLATRQSAWPEWHQSHVVVLPVGLRFQMALAPGQDPSRPGAFGTFDDIPDVEFVRTALAVSVDWKPQIDRVVVYEVARPLLADVGTVGPQIDARTGRYLRGGASQFQMLVRPCDRMGHVRVIGVRSIH